MGMHLTSLQWLAFLTNINFRSLESISQVERSPCLLHYTMLYRDINLMILHQHN